MKISVIAGFTFILFLAGCSSKSENNSPATENSWEVRINNYNFESGGKSQTPASWNTLAEDSDQDADFTTDGGIGGSVCLTHSKDTPYKVLTWQKIENLDSGYYTLTARTRNSGGQKTCYLSAADFGSKEKMTSLPVSYSWVQVIIRGIHITEGECRIGLYSDANAGNWCAMDEIRMVRDDKKYDFLKGGDLSELSYIESMGGNFFEDGIRADCMKLLKDNGFNLVRLRLYNDPGNPAFTPSNRLPAGFQNEADILRLSRRAKELGMMIQLTFYYSDYWSNDITHLWQNLSLPVLKDSVYNFTWKFMNKMTAQGTTPEFVSIGNEIAGGLLKPMGSSENFPQMAEFLKQGYNAVKAVSPSTKVILHLDDAGNKDKYSWFFDACNTNGVHYDIIGASYYPFWTQKTVSQILEWADYVSSKFQKDILIMETGYPWNPTLPDGKTGQLANNGPYSNVYMSSPEGQRDFLFECFNGLKSAKGGRVIGALYWDPVMIEVPGVGWEVGADNVVSNTTLFDFYGNALPSLKAFLFNN